MPARVCRGRYFLRGRVCHPDIRIMAPRVATSRTLGFPPGPRVAEPPDMNTTTVKVDGGMELTVWTTRDPFVNGGRVLTVWAKVQAGRGEFHTVTFFPTGMFGRVGTESAPAWITDLPGGSPERLAALKGWRAGQDRLVAEAVLTAFPWLQGLPVRNHEVLVSA